jgi:septum formation protein
VVTLGGVIYGKPTDERHAFETLSRLSGHSHTVHTGVKLISSFRGVERTLKFSEVTEVGRAFLSIGPTYYWHR